MAYKTLKQLYYGDADAYKSEYLSRFNSETAVKLDFDIGGAQAFFVENAELFKLIIEILRLDKEAGALCSQLPGVAKGQYAQKCLIDEIVLTNRIEGVHSSRKDIIESLNMLEKQSDEKGKKKRFNSLVKTYLLLMQEETIELKTCRDVRDLYDKALLDEVAEEDPRHVPDGELFRTELTEIYSATGKVLHRGLYPEQKILKAMEKALSLLNDESLDALCRICLFHYLIEYIHPFYDGNGRLGRLILSFGLSEQLEPLLAFRISETIREKLKAYYDAFETCNDSRNLGDLTPFLLMMLAMIRDALSDLNASLLRRLGSWKKYEKLIELFDIPDDKNGINLRRMYSFLIQAALFSEDGISTKKLIDYFDSRYNVNKYLSSIPQNLLILQKSGIENHYMIDLKALDEILLNHKRDTDAQ